MFKFDMEAHTVEEIKILGENMSEEVLLRFVSMREQLISKT